MCRNIRLILLLLFSAKLCYAQIYSLQNYTPENGLPTRTVYDITQDSTGIMWFATGVGVSSYDGLRFTNYNFLKQVFKTAYRRIITDEKGYVWCLPYYTRDSIKVLKNNEWSNFPAPVQPFPSLETTSFNVFYENGSPVLCLGSTIGIFINKGNDWKLYNSDNGLSGNEILNVTAHDNKFYVCTRNGLSVYNSGSIDNSFNRIISSKNVSVLNVNFQKLVTGTKSNDFRMWVLLSDKLGYIEEGSFKEIEKGFSIPVLSSFIACSMTIDSRNNIYFGSGWMKYCYSISKDNLVQLFKENGFPSDGGTAIFLDREENLWISDTRGLSKLNSLAFRNHNKSVGLLEDDVASVNEMSPGKYIFGHNQGITISDNHIFKYINFNEYKNYKTSASRVLDIYKDVKGDLWLAAHLMGVARMDKAGKLEWMSTPDSLIFTSVISDSDGNIIAACNKGIYVLKNKVFEKYKPGIMPSTPLRKFFDLKDGNLYASTPSGFFIFENQKYKQINIPDNPKASSVFSIIKDNKNRILLGTLDGLYIYQNDSMYKYTENNFSVDDEIFAMVKDRYNHYWIGTNKGLIYWDGLETKREYNSKNGLVPGEVNRSALFFDSADRLWIGTDMGASRFIPELDNIRKTAPKVVINGIIVNGGNNFTNKDDLTFGQKSNNLKFVFHALSFVNEKSIEYKVKLEGFDKDWVDLKQSDIESVSYGNLSPGEYVFKVKARNQSGEWSKEESTKTITIEKPFYLKLWFILLTVLTALAGLYGLHIHLNRRKYLAKVEDEVQNRTKELAKAKNDLYAVNESLEEKVTERTRELSESEIKYRTVVEQASDGIVICDLKSRKFLQVNDAYANMLGYSKNELLSLTLYDIVTQEKESMDINVEKIDNEKLIYIGEDYHRKKDGSILPAEISVRKIIYMGIPSMCAVVRDISERKKMQQALFDSEKRFRELVELLPEPVFETDLEGNLIFTNNAGLKLFEYSREDFVKGINIFDLIDPAEVEKAIERFRYIKNGILSSGYESDALKKDGSHFVVYINSVPIVEDGKTVGILGIAIDMTSQKAFEENLLKLSEKQKELIASKDKFFSIMAHDLRSPFTSLIGFTELLNNESESMSKEDREKYSNHVYNSARKVFDLLDNLLHWGGLQTGKMKATLIRINLEERLKTSIDLLKDNSGKKEILVENNISGKLFVEADSFMINSVLQNLLSNAIKFTPRKGVIKVSAEFVNGMVNVYISDNGVGIPEDKLDIIFKIDQRTSTLGTENEMGTGLGIILCKEMIERQGGTFEILSEVNKGTTVKICLSGSEE